MAETISVIIGVYNHLKYLPKVIKGWEDQTFGNFKVYICDDGSNDGTENYIREVMLTSKLDIQYFRQENKGMRLAKNINQGLKVATGKYAIFCMGDSVPKENYLMEMFKLCKQNRVLCGVRENVSIDMEHISWDWRYKYRNGQIGQGFMFVHNRPWSRLTGNGLLVPMKAMKNIGYWPEEYEGYGCDDNYIVLSLFVQGLEFMEVHSAILQHFYHLSQTDNLKSKRLFGRYYRTVMKQLKKDLAPQEVYLNFDDFTPVQNNLFFLRKLKENYPNLKVTVFLTPESIQSGKIESFIDHPDLCDELRELDWLEYCPHGWNHPDMKSGIAPEFSSMSYYETVNYIELVDQFFKKINLPYVKIFKAPQYQLSEASKDCFRDNGWTICVDGEGSWFPKDIKTLSYNWNIKDEFPLRKKVVAYAHISDIGNGMVECWKRLLEMPTNSNFKFLSDL